MSAPNPGAAAAALVIVAGMLLVIIGLIGWLLVGGNR